MTPACRLLVVKSGMELLFTMRHVHFFVNFVVFKLEMYPESC